MDQNGMPDHYPQFRGMRHGNQVGLPGFDKHLVEERIKKLPGGMVGVVIWIKTAKEANWKPVLGQH